MLGANDKVYIDTNTFVYQLVNTSHPLNAKAQRFFMDIQSKKFKGLTTTFVKTEFLAVLKKLLAEQLKVAPHQTLVDVGWKQFELFLDNMGIEEFDADDFVKDCKFFDDSHDRVAKANPVQGKDKKWRILNGADSLHLIFAERVTATKLMTSDEGFRTSKSTVQPVILREEYP